jgi:hypothetical protein
VLYTNFQTAVKPRDLRSNDKRVLNLKKNLEESYPQGYFITKRWEEALLTKDMYVCVSSIKKTLIAKY